MKDNWKGHHKRKFVLIFSRHESLSHSDEYDNTAHENIFAMTLVQKRKTSLSTEKEKPLTASYGYSGILTIGYILASTLTSRSEILPWFVHILWLQCFWHPQLLLVFLAALLFSESSIYPLQISSMKQLQVFLFLNVVMIDLIKVFVQSGKHLIGLKMHCWQQASLQDTHEFYPALHKIQIV